MDVSVGVYKLVDNAVLPDVGTALSACYDLRACFHNNSVKIRGTSYKRVIQNFETDDAHIIIYPSETVLIPTGLIFCLPQTHHLKIYSRSGNVLKRGLVVANQPAIIDSDYTNETFVIIENMSNKQQIIYNGDAIAQCEICLNSSMVFNELDDISFNEFSEYIKFISNRNGGFGSTDK